MIFVELLFTCLDLQVEKELQPWRKLIEREGQRTIGHSAVTLKRRQCFQAECPLGNYLANATADYYRRFIKAANNLWTSASIVLFNVGSFRVDLNAGSRYRLLSGIYNFIIKKLHYFTDITIADLRTILPNDNTMDYAELRGSALLEVLEHAVSLIRTGEEFMAKYMIQFAGKCLLIMTNDLYVIRIFCFQLRTASAVQHNTTGGKTCGQSRGTLPSM